MSKCNMCIRNEDKAPFLNTVLPAYMFEKWENNEPRLSTKWFSNFHTFPWNMLKQFSREWFKRNLDWQLTVDVLKKKHELKKLGHFKFWNHLKKIVHSLSCVIPHQRRRQIHVLDCGCGETYTKAEFSRLWFNTHLWEDSQSSTWLSFILNYKNGENYLNIIFVDCFTITWISSTTLSEQELAGITVYMLRLAYNCKAWPGLWISVYARLTLPQEISYHTRLLEDYCGSIFSALWCATLWKWKIF